MGGSAAEGPTPAEAGPTPGGVRASDADRDEVASRLRDEFVAGRLSHDTFLHRMDAAYQARQHDELSPLLEGLPSQPPRVSPLQAGGRSVAGWFRGAWSRVSGSAAVVRYDHDSAPRTVTPAAAPAARATMSLQAAASARRPLPLQFPRGSAEQFSIGRDAGCDLAIADMTVSRRHATLERTDDGWLLTDLQSTNGTRVNGWRVRGKVSVTPGDLVSFGNCEYSLCLSRGTTPCTPRSWRAFAPIPPTGWSPRGEVPAPHVHGLLAAAPSVRISRTAHGQASAYLSVLTTRIVSLSFLTTRFGQFGRKSGQNR